tara:strand:- start:2880 stop:3080 length:201 start_codon:yes stop_codon:yes gene_type:complete
MKNWEPFVLGPLLAIDTMPRAVCMFSGWISSLNLPPQMLSPPLPVPVGSPPCSMKPLMLRWKSVLS